MLHVCGYTKLIVCLQNDDKIDIIMNELFQMV